MVGRNDLRGMTDAWQAYIDLALGYTETSRKRATKVVKQLAGKGNATADQLQAMAEDLVKQGLTNREALTRLVRFELDRALGRVGLATADEVAELTGRVRDLEDKLRAGTAAPAAAAAVVESPAPEPPAAAKRAPAKAAPAKRAPAKAAPAKSSTAKAAPDTAAPAEVPAAAGTPAKKTVAKKTVAKKAVAKKTAGATA
jgi:polyhydroxyalkanoate synthesis regulator phasin